MKKLKIGNDFLTGYYLGQKFDGEFKETGLRRYQPY